MPGSVSGYVMSKQPPNEPQVVCRTVSGWAALRAVASVMPDTVSEAQAILGDAHRSEHGLPRGG